MQHSSLEDKRSVVSTMLGVFGNKRELETQAFLENT